MVRRILLALAVLAAGFVAFLRVVGSGVLGSGVLGRHWGRRPRPVPAESVARRDAAICDADRGLDVPDEVPSQTVFGGLHVRTT